MKILCIDDALDLTHGPTYRSLRREEWFDLNFYTPSNSHYRKENPTFEGPEELIALLKQNYQGLIIEPRMLQPKGQRMEEIVTEFERYATAIIESGFAGKVVVFTSNAYVPLLNTIQRTSWPLFCAPLDNFETANLSRALKGLPLKALEPFQGRGFTLCLSCEHFDEPCDPRYC
ncbi:MAG: hypothetical protein WCV90_04275 [Candidatus Woesearchaeota archaeon]|jgi:hypothetical protein